MNPADVPWDEWHRNLRAFIARRVPNDADADDLVQRVLLQVVRGLGSVRGDDRIGAWIYRTARNAIIDHYRSAVVRREVPLGGHDEPVFADRAAPSDVDDPTALEELAARCLSPLVARLSPSARQALQLVEVEGMTQIEAAEKLGLSVSGMKSRMQRARRQLKALVDQCCRVDLDRRGGVISYAPKDTCACGTCADAGTKSGRPAIPSPAARRAAS